MAFTVHSLRSRVLLAIALITLVVMGCVMVLSYWMAEWQSDRDQQRRYQAIRSTLREAPFPLAQGFVLETISQLAAAEFVTVDGDGNIGPHTLADEIDLEVLQNAIEPPMAEIVDLGGRAFRHRQFEKPGVQGGQAIFVLVLFDESDRVATRRRYATLPLLTGLASTALLSLVAAVMSTRIIRRITRLKDRVADIAEGKFSEDGPQSPGETWSSASDPSDDEVGQLDRAVVQMGQDLASLWSAVNRSQRERLIHQLGAGLAHQLRNSLTGARMAVELHDRRCNDDQDSELPVALQELKRTEELVQRILLLGKRSSEHRARDIASVLREAVDSSRPVAQHLHVALTTDWDDAALEKTKVGDSESLSSAVGNLVLNAIHAGGDQVQVLSKLLDERLEVVVIDNGPGPPAEIKSQLFEPFVTGRPEGLGLGLALVKQCAQQMDGTIGWERDGDLTRFCLSVAVG